MPNLHSSTSRSPIISPNRRTHRKRISALRLSSDTTSTLPEYIPTDGWSQTTTKTTTTSTTTTTGTGRPDIEATSASQFGIHHGLGPPLDLPPDYPDSAEEADEDTDVDGDTTFEGGLYTRHREHRQHQEYVPPFTVYHHGYPRASFGTKSSKNFRKYPSHNPTRSLGSTSSLKSPSLPPPTRSTPTSPLPSPTASDLFLDSLLERSVHALEMSNALLQSSMSTRSSLSNLISAGAGPDETLGVVKREPERYADLESRIKTWKNVRETWADDLDEIKKGVERLFGGGEGGASVDDTEVEVGRDSQSNRRRRDHDREAFRSEGNISSSMPAESPLKQRAYSQSSHNHPHERSISSASIDARRFGEDNNGPTPQLRFEQQQRERLVAHPPRALTQYVAANSDTNIIVLPSTLGLRSTSSSHRVVTDITAKGGAYSALSSLASKSPGCTGSASSTRSSSTLTPPQKEPGSRSSSNSNVAHPAQHVPYKRRKSTSPPRSHSWVGMGIIGRSRSETPKPAVGKGPVSSGFTFRRMTPPIESLSSSSQSSSSSSSEEDDGETIVDGQRRKRGPSAKQTVQELRRILDEQPSPQLPQPEAKFELILRPPALLQKVGGTGTTADAGTSNATASVSRLLTKNKHSSSTRPPSPPRQSALKGRSAPGTPTTPATPGALPTSSAIEAAVQAAQATAKPVSGSTTNSGSAFRVFSFAKSAFLGNGKGKAKEESSKSGFLSPPALSPSGSGASTPKRISFAELPESYSGGNGKGRTSRKGHRRKRSLSDSDSVEDEGWFGWLIGGSVSTLRQDRMEDRIDRPWGNGPGSGRLMGGGIFSSGMDDWAV